MGELSLNSIERLIDRLALLNFEPFCTANHRQLGDFQTAQVGQGDDFHSFTRFRQGDDPRLVDWSAFARTKKLWSRRYQANRIRNLILVLDASASMAVDGGQKWKRGVEIALVLQSLGMKGGHPSPVFLVDAGGLTAVPSVNEGYSLADSLDWLVHYPLNEKSGFHGIETLIGGYHGELCLISDFMLGGGWETLNGIVQSEALALSLIRMSSNSDCIVPNGNFRDPESSRVGQVSRAELAVAQQVLEEFRKRIFDWCQEWGVLGYDWMGRGSLKEFEHWCELRSLHQQAVNRT